MMSRLVSVGALALAVVLASGACAAEKEAKQLKKGDDAPTYKLGASDGKTYSSKELMGKTVVIAWFPKAFTGGCTKECMSFRDNAKMLDQFDIAYFTASVDDVETNTRFAKKLGLSYPILSDSTKATAKAFGILNPKGMAKRVTFVIDPKGKIQYVENKVKAASHGPQLIETLKELNVPMKAEGKS